MQSSGWDAMGIEATLFLMKFRVQVFAVVYSAISVVGDCRPHALGDVIEHCPGSILSLIGSNLWRKARIDTMVIQLYFQLNRALL